MMFRMATSKAEFALAGEAGILRCLGLDGHRDFLGVLQPTET
jgi:hypothetical protein